MELFYNILLFLDGIIYSFIDKLYQLFMALASARILTEENIQHFMDRIYIVLGVIMLFVLAYSILMSIINPDNMNKSENGTGKIVKNIVISLVASNYPNSDEIINNGNKQLENNNEIVQIEYMI